MIHKCHFYNYYFFLYLAKVHEHHTINRTHQITAIFATKMSLFFTVSSTNFRYSIREVQ